MADTKTSALTAVTTPAGTDELPVNQAGTSKKMTLTQATAYIAPITNSSTANQTPAAATDVYLINSGIALPQTRLRAGTFVWWRIFASKTAAGTVAPIFTIRHGTGQATTDTSRCAITCGAQAATVNAGAIIDVMATFRTVGGAGVATLQGGVGGSVTGFHTVGGQALSSTFDSTVASTFLGLSVNTGTSAAWTIYTVTPVLFNIA